MTHKELVLIAERWVKKNASCGVVLRELRSYTNETPDVIGFGSHGHSVVVECKRTRSDFFADKGKRSRIEGAGMGEYRLYLTPRGLVKPEDLPMGWGLLEVAENGKVLRTVDTIRWKPDRKRFTPNRLAERAVMYSVLRRMAIRGHIKNVYLSARAALAEKEEEV